MKKVLIISPYFPPSNAADMQRVRMSLPYFAAFNWEAEVVCADEQHSEMVKDELFKASLPENLKIHTVDAFSKKYTAKFGLGSLALRSMWHFKNKVDQLLKSSHYDLIYFSTTQFPITILGAHWKRKFQIPYVIDMQDPWHSDYYEDKPKSQRPKKYWFSYRLNKFLEPIAMKNVDGIISVAGAYIQTLQERYANINQIPTTVITFGAFEKDFEIAQRYKNQIDIAFKKTAKRFDLVYIGRGGYDMQKAVKLLFRGFKKGLDQNNALFNAMKFHFIGTSYAPAGMGKKSILPIAQEIGVAQYVDEQTDRISFYQNIASLLQSDALIIPGSDDPAYTASKIYPYILAKKPLLAIFSTTSSASHIIKELGAGTVADLHHEEKAIETIYNFLKNLDKESAPLTNWGLFETYTAKEMTHKQCAFFNEVLATRR